MGKHLTNFKTKEEYEAFKASGEYITPNVSFIETAGSVINDSYQIQGGSASSMEYLDTTGINIQQYDVNAQATLLSFGDDAKTVSDMGLGVYPMALSCINITRNEDFQLIAMSFNKDKRAMLKTPDGEIMSMTWKEFSSLLDPTLYEVLNSCPRITKEEFYNLDNGGSSLIEFTINGTPYQAEEGMTWGEFVKSSYNDGSVNVQSSGYIRQNGQYLSSPESGFTLEGDAIISGFNYQYLDV